MIFIRGFTTIEEIDKNTPAVKYDWRPFLNVIP